MDINELTHLYPLSILPNPNPPKSPILTPLVATLSKAPFKGCDAFTNKALLSIKSIFIIFGN